MDAPDPRGQRVPGHVLHSDEAPAFRHADLINGGDVRMIERGGGLCFVLEAPHPVGIGGQIYRQELERDLAAKPRVSSRVDLTHSASAQQRDNLVVTDGLPNERPRMALDEQRCGHLHRGDFDEAVSFLIGSEQRLDFVAQVRVSVAHFTEEGRTIAGRALERRLKDRIDLSPALGSHVVPL